MTIRYTKTEITSFGRLFVQITDKDTGNTFPESDNNRHYQEYKEWLSSGNEPDVVVMEESCEVK